MRELVHYIDTHVEMVDLEVTRNLHVEEGQGQTLAADQPTKSATARRTDEATKAPPIKLSV